MQGRDLEFLWLSFLNFMTLLNYIKQMVVDVNTHVVLQL